MSLKWRIRNGNFATGGMLLSCLLGLLAGTIFFNIRGYEESVSVRINPAFFYNLVPGDDGLKYAAKSIIEDGAYFRRRLLKHYNLACSPSGMHPRILVRSETKDLWDYEFRRAPQADSFTDAIECSVRKSVEAHSEIFRYLAETRRQLVSSTCLPSPPLVKDFEVSEIISIVDHTWKVRVISQIRAVVFGLIFSLIVSVFLRSSSRHRSPRGFSEGRNP